MSSSTVISGSIKINSPKDNVWEIISDLGGIQNYHPLVNKSYNLTNQTEGVGAGRICEFKNGGVLREESVEWQEGDFVNLKVIPVKRMPPFKSAFAKMAVEEIDNKTIASLTIEYDLKYGLLGKVMNKLMVKSQFEKVLPKILSGLKRYSEAEKTESVHLLNLTESA